MAVAKATAVKAMPKEKAKAPAPAGSRPQRLILPDGCRDLPDAEDRRRWPQDEFVWRALFASLDPNTQSMFACRTIRARAMDERNFRQLT